MSAAPRPATAGAILGVSPDRPGRVRLWLWSQAASITVLGAYAPAVVPIIVARLQRNQPDLQVYVDRAVAL